MKKILFPILCASVILVSCKEQKQPKKNITVNYPETTKKPVVEDYFGTKVTDNYRWLEDDRSPETENWVITKK